MNCRVTVQAFSGFSREIWESYHKSVWYILIKPVSNLYKSGFKKFLKISHENKG